MNNIHSKRGFTLIELLIVMAILLVLATVAVPSAFGIIDRARVETDKENVRILNAVTPLYRGDDLSTDPFADHTKTSEELIESLVDGGYLASMIEPQRKDSMFVWAIDMNVWLYSDEEGNLFYFTFNGTGLSSIEDLENLTPRYSNREWEIAEGGLRSTFNTLSWDTENILYIGSDEEISRNYLITASVAMNDGPGYGILFDTVLSGSTESGYSLQYERGSGGRIIIRPRINGRENPNIDDLGGIDNWESHYLYQSLTAQERSQLLEGKRVSPILYNYRLSDSQKAQLEAGNTLKLNVADSDSGRRKVDVYLGDDKVIDGLEYNAVDADTPMETSGYRVWNNGGYNGENVRFTSFDIQNTDD